jgi:hypothetical protein
MVLEAPMVEAWYLWKETWYLWKEAWYLWKGAWYLWKEAWYLWKEAWYLWKEAWYLWEVAWYLWKEAWYLWKEGEGAMYHGRRRGRSMCGLSVEGGDHQCKPSKRRHCGCLLIHAVDKILFQPIGTHL